MAAFFMPVWYDNPHQTLECETRMSLFYDAHFEHLFPIPLIAFERLSALQHLPPETALRQVLSECCHKPKPTNAELEYFLSRIKADSDAAQTKVANASEALHETEKTKTLGTSFQKLLSELDSARMLLWACGFDYARANQLYTRVDRAIATQIIEDFIRIQTEKNSYLFEAALYGFGGSYKNDERGGEGDIDMSDMDAASIMQMLS